MKSATDYANTQRRQAKAMERELFCEGIVQRGENVLEALQERKLFIGSRVAGTGDWAVISGQIYV